MPELKLPPAEFMGCKGFKLPGENAMRDMQATFDVQRSEMDQHKNARTGELAKGDTGTGDTPCFEVHFDDDAQSAVIFAYAELIANVFDVPVTAGLLDEVDITFLVSRATGAITITRGDGEGLAGFAPTGGGIVLWNMSTPFSPAALVRGGKTRPKLLTKKGTGGFNYGLKQLVKNCLGDEIQPEFQFIGYLKDRAEGEASDDARPPTGAKAMTTYRWVPLRKNPNTIKFKEDPLQRVEFECNVPIVVQRVGPETWRTGRKKFPKAWLQPFCKRQWARFARALSTFMRVYKCDRSAGPCMRGMPYREGGVDLGSPEILHRDCFSLLLSNFAGYNLELPPGPLLLVGERFYQIADGAGLENLVLRIPGKGMKGEYKAFYSEARRVSLARFVELLGTVIVGVISAAETVASPETLVIRKELANQLMPLLVNVDSPVFGEARGPLIASLMNLGIIRANINPLRNLLIREVLRGSPDAQGLSEQEFEAKITKNPIVHSGGDVLRASVLAELIGTFQVPVNTDDVHPLLYRSTNMQMAERRAAEAVHFNRKKPPSSLPDALLQVAEFVLGKHTEVAFLPLPAKAELAEAAVPFRHDDDADGVHLAVMWQRSDAFELVRQVCDLRVVGVKCQMERADAVRQALNAPECLNQDLELMCEAILALVRKDGAGYSSDSGKKDKAPDLKEWQKNALSLEKEKKKRERGSDSDSDSSSSDDEKLSTRDPDKSARRKKKKGRSRASTPVLREPPPFVAQPGKDGVQDGGGTKGVTTVVSRPGGKCHHREPLPGEPDVLTHLNQKPITMGAETVYVPSESAADGADLAAPEGFADRFNAYKMAKFAIVRRIGITARVMPTWSPAANWSGIAMHGDNLLLVNLPKLKTRGQFEETILHEMAHDLCGAGCGHNKSWYNKLGQLNASLSDAKYADGAL